MRCVLAGLVVFSTCGFVSGQNAPPAGVQPPRSAAQPPATVQPRPGQPGAVQPAPGQQVIPGQPARAQLAQAGGQMSSADQQIAAKIHGCSHNEIEISKFAQSKLQSAAARAFAEKMVTDHTADAESYQRWAGRQGDAGVRPEAAPAEHATQRGGGLDWNKIHEQVAKQCLESAKQELGRHPGSEFDQAFMGMQLGGHLHMQDELKVLRNHASPELQQQIDKSLQVVQTHLQHARQVMETLKDRPAERVSRRPEDKK